MQGKISLLVIYLLVYLIFLGCDSTDINNKIEKLQRYDGSWASLQTMPVPAWYDDGKIGIFIHWGPYSVMGYKKGGKGYSEHIARTMYGDTTHYYSYMREKWGACPPEFGYKDIIPKFTAAKWNPDKWANLFSEVGAKYVVMTAEHHDGFAMWDSDLTSWNAVEKGPKRDLVGDLGEAVRKKGLKYAPSYHRERHTGFFTKKQFVVQGEPRDAILEEIKRVPESATLYGPFTYSNEFVDDYVARWKEIQRKYKPDFLWMDDYPIYTRDGNHVRKGIMKPEVKYFDDQVRAMITDFMNDAAERGQPVYLNNKGKNMNWPAGIGCLEKDNLSLSVVGPKWQSCTTFGTSYGYLAAEEAEDYPYRKRSVEETIHILVRVVSKNGNLLINIGPRGDGTIPEWQVERLRGMGDWLKINGEAIYGTRYWKEHTQENESLSFTVKDKVLYAIKREKPVTPFVIEASKGWKKDQVKSVRLIGSDASVEYNISENGLKIIPPKDIGSSKFAWVFEVVTTKNKYHQNVIETDAEKVLKQSEH